MAEGQPEHQNTQQRDYLIGYPGDPFYEDALRWTDVTPEKTHRVALELRKFAYQMAQQDVIDTTTDRFEHEVDVLMIFTQAAIMRIIEGESSIQ